MSKKAENLIGLSEPEISAIKKINESFSGKGFSYLYLKNHRNIINR